MSHQDHTDEVATTPPPGAVAGKQLGVMLACFDGAKSAAKAHKPLSKEITEGDDSILDEVVLSVSSKRKVHVYDPRRVLAGTLTPALTWGVFGLLASSGSIKSLVIWGVIGGICGGLNAYYTEHLATKSELKRIGRQMGPDSSAMLAFVETSNARGIAAPAAKYKPVNASVAEIEPDLFARVFSGTSDPVELPPAPRNGQPHAADRNTVLSMVLLRFKGQHAVRDVEKKLTGAKGPEHALQTELLFEVDPHGHAHVSSPGKGVGAMGQSALVGWGLFGLVYGAIVGLANNGGIVGGVKGGVVTGIIWAAFGLVAGALYGLWSGRAVSARRLKGIGPLLPPDSSMLLAWADGEIGEQAVADLSTPDTHSLVLRFNAAGHGLQLQV